ncbi:hypothetical protein PF007_g7354 [Phytophthora fragariae]|uniref:Uncharacterized protein n=1 Tax=Phytophthora fragariae TaxID=53985 RepID=A0A6A3UES2_9STRA|nr:hypothetical protein PF003_g7092 [Phytophthora fragariae]KAE8942481.1 hypothetical protein PF009_g7778 [Phytophthora fragariae]KAE9122696.1 hypothetical protein PF007_g7354 [Phytophthora fragariae]KAE9149343.1 hypothetical protein PF006_g6182 [Phytophthora fragariae]KAE9232028.1 hypothetical protein PF004_g10049 [Phytophthora fragariae]
MAQALEGRNNDPASASQAQTACPEAGALSGSEENGEGGSSEQSSGDSASVSPPLRRQRTRAIDDSDKD